MSQIKCLIMAFNKTIAEELADRLSTLSKYNDFTPSSYQQQLISFVMKGTGNGIVQAVAGSGKTTTIMQAMNELRKQHGTLTNPITDNLKSDYSGITFESGTTHSVCNRAGRKMPHQVFGGKTMHLINGGYNKSFYTKDQSGQSRKVTLPNIEPKIPEIQKFVHNACIRVGEDATVSAKNYRTGQTYQKDSKLAYVSINTFKNIVKTLVSTMKNCGVGIFDNRPMTEDTAREIYDYYFQSPFLKKKRAEVWGMIENQVFPFAIKILKEGSKMKSFWDFDDMFYMPALYDLSFEKYDFIFLDECQDTNLVTQKLIEKMLTPSGRVVAVGDVAQAIYAFRGADADAMTEFKNRFNAITIPLSLCYRCGTRIIQKTNEIYNEYDRSFPYTQIKSLDESPRGLVNHYPVGLDQMTREMALELFNNQTGVICRKNAPLMGLVVKLFTWGIPANFLGRSEGGKSIINKVGFRLDTFSKGYAYDMNNNNLKLSKLSKTPTMDKFKKHEDTLFNFQLKAMQDNDDKDAISKHIDDHQALMHVLTLLESKGKTTVDIKEVTTLINDLFSEAEDGKSVTLCSVHKSKGLEFHRAIILDFAVAFNLQFVPETHNHLYLQETNMTYVAFTRAERELVFVDSISSNPEE